MPLRYKIERDELEERLGGGLPTGALIVIEGENGTGKSILSQRFAYGLLENGCNLAYVSTELTTMSFIEQMASLDYGVDEYVLTGKLVFVPVFPILGYRARRDDLLDRLVRARKLFSRDVVVVDAFSTLLKNYVGAVKGRTSIPAKMDEAIYTFKLLNAQGKTIILTIDPEEVDPEITSFLRSAADVLISGSIESVGGAVGRALFVRRFSRASGAVADVLNFRVEPNAGFIVEIKSVS